MQCGSCENHPADPSMSLCSTTGMLRRSSSDLSIHRGNGCRALTKTKVLGRVRPQNRTAGCRSLSGRKGNRASVPKGGNRRSSQEVKGCRVEGWGRYTLRPKAQNVGQQYRVLFRGRDVENREERREPLYWRVFTLPHKGRSRLGAS